MPDSGEIQNTSEMVRFPGTLPGHHHSGYYASPGDRTKAPGIVVVHEYWGLRTEIKDVVDRFMALGYQAIAPDLFGKIAQTGDEANKLMQGLDRTAAVREIEAAAGFLRTKGASRVAVIGFCMGGSLTLLSALKLQTLNAAVCCYGLLMPNDGDPGTIKIPLQLHFADKDEFYTPEMVTVLENQLKAGGANFELYRYPAQHAFMNHLRKEVYDPDQTAIAFQRIVQFLGANLSEPPKT
jgi:carboxymethylenebutenolidase